MKYDIILVSESLNDRIVPSSLELLEFGRQLSKFARAGMALLLPGVKTAGEAEAIGKKFGVTAIALENRHLECINPEILQKGVIEAIARYKPEYICFIHSITGSAVAPAVAAVTGSSCITGVESFRSEGAGLSFRRRIFGGKLVSEVTPLKDRCVLTILPGSFPHNRNDFVESPSSTVTEAIVFDYDPAGCFVKGQIKGGAGMKKLDEAEVIVSAGRGIGRKENIDLIERISGIFGKSAVGASRPVCDMGWLPYSHQIGLTGNTVSPKLYLACGISGSPQHIAGMKNSGIIVSINSDPHAAIFSISHFIIVDDVVQFLPVLVERYHEIYRQGKV